MYSLYTFAFIRMKRDKFIVQIKVHLKSRGIMDIGEVAKKAKVTNGYPTFFMKRKD